MLTPLPSRHEANVAAMESALRHGGPSVVVFRRECIQSLRRGVLKDHDRAARESHSTCPAEACS